MIRALATRCVGLAQAPHQLALRARSLLSIPSSVPRPVSIAVLLGISSIKQIFSVSSATTVVVNASDQVQTNALTVNLAISKKMGNACLTALRVSLKILLVDNA